MNPSCSCRACTATRKNQNRLTAILSTLLAILVWMLVNEMRK